MAAAFDAMLDRVQFAFERERRFSAEASHELRTPLATIKSGIGVSLSRARTVEEHEATLQSLDEQVDQLIRLCDDLLVLARSGRPRSAESEVVDMTSLLELVVEQFEPLAEERNVTIRTHIRRRLTLTGVLGRSDQAVPQPAGKRSQVHSGRAAGWPLSARNSHGYIHVSHHRHRPRHRAQAPAPPVRALLSR